MSEEQKQKISKLIKEIDQYYYQVGIDGGLPSGFSVWHNKVIRTLESIFGPSSTQKNQFDRIEFFDPMANSLENRTSFEKAKMNAKGNLQSFLDDIDELSKKNGIQSISGNDIFIVHGHDDELKTQVARLVEHLGYRAIILHEQLNRSRTIIRKLIEESASARYAIILLTPDDIGHDKTKENEIEDRPRQNVVLELGYFLGTIKFENVCVLLKGFVKMPSDFDGVTYCPVDSVGKWKYDLAKEMQGAGLNIDLSKVA